MRIGVFTFLLLLAACAQAQQENLIPAIGALDRGDYKQATAYELGLGIAAGTAQAKTWREQAKKKPDPAEAGKNDASGSQRADPRRSKP